MLLRFALAPIGLLLAVIRLAVSGSRDLHNRLRFRPAIIDSGCIIDANSSIATVCHVLDGCLILNSAIGKFSYIGRRCVLRNVTIGRYCSIADDVAMGLGRHPVANFSTSPVTYRIQNTLNVSSASADTEFVEHLPVHIGNDVWIGARALIMDGVRVNDGAIVAANAVVTKEVPAYAVVAGCPARVIRMRFPSNLITSISETKWWLMDPEQLKERQQELIALVGMSRDAN